mmetsp:Transcript_26239/g.53249  ORF Transcript_26239/g.53249 Transcript_26239/m.53249 type:complete len:118 (-) Transcript_26239:1490-1843(-)
MSNYNECVATYSYGADTSDGSVTEAELTAQLVACIVDQRVSATSDTAELSSSIDAFFLIFAASLVFFMQAGFAMLCAGSVQKKNVQNTMVSKGKRRLVLFRFISNFDFYRYVVELSS